MQNTGDLLTHHVSCAKHQETGSIPGSWSPEEGMGTHSSIVPGESHGQRSLQSTATVHGVAKNWTRLSDLVNYFLLIQHQLSWFKAELRPFSELVYFHFLFNTRNCIFWVPNSEPWLFMTAPRLYGLWTPILSNWVQRTAASIAQSFRFSVAQWTLSAVHINWSWE